MSAGNGNALVVNEQGQVTTDHVADDVPVEASAPVEGDVVAQSDPQPSVDPSVVVGPQEAPQGDVPESAPPQSW